MKVEGNERTNAMIANIETTMEQLNEKWSNCLIPDLLIDIAQLTAWAKESTFKGEIASSWLTLAKYIYELRIGGDLID